MYGNQSISRGSSKVAFTFAAILATFACALLLAFQGTELAWAGAQPGQPTLEDLGGKSYTVSFKGADHHDSGYRTYASSKNPQAKISDAKSSNESVATVVVNEYGGNYNMQVIIKKVGTTKISYKVGGKKHTVNYKVVKYTNPAKSFKVGGKEYASKFAPKNLEYGGEILSVNANGTGISGKVTLKLAKGWKLKKMWYWTAASEMKYFKNGDSIPKAVTAYAWVKKGTLSERLYLYAQ